MVRKRDASAWQENPTRIGTTSIESNNLTRMWVIFSDLSDVPENLPLPAPGSESPQALNYSQIASAAVAVSQGGQDPSVSSTETLLRNIQGLLKVAADNARQQERQINYEKGQWHGFLNASLAEAAISLSASSREAALRDISLFTDPSIPFSFLSSSLPFFPSLSIVRSYLC